MWTIKEVGPETLIAWTELEAIGRDKSSKQMVGKVALLSRSVVPDHLF